MQTRIILGVRGLLLGIWFPCSQKAALKVELSSPDPEKLWAEREGWESGLQIEWVGGRGKEELQAQAPPGCLGDGERRWGGGWMREKWLGGLSYLSITILTPSSSIHLCFFCS